MSDRDNHDAGLADRIAAHLRTDHEASRRPAAPRPPPAPVPDWLFGPRHRELDAARRVAVEAARSRPTLSPEPPVECCRACGRPMVGADR